MVRLASITINRFRGIREGTVENLTDVNVLIGRNNSGKTSVSEAIMRTCYGNESRSDLLGRPIFHIWNQPRNEDHQYPAELWYRQEKSQTIALRAEFVGRSGPVAVELTIREVPGSLNVNSTLGRAVHDNVMADYVGRVSVFRPLESMNRNIEKMLWPNLIAGRRDKLLTQALNEVFSLNAEGFQLIPDAKLLVLYPEHGLPLDAQGDGTRAAMRCLMMLSSLKGTLFIIEEPECHQHPGSLERFALTLCKRAKAQDVQLIISTHSAECVRAFLKASEEAGSESAVFHLSLEDGHLDARRLDAEAVETLQNTGVDVRFLDLYA